MRRFRTGLKAVFGRGAPAVLVLVGFAAPLDGQPTGDTRHPPVVLPGTEVRQLASTVNGIDYELYVALPTAYAESAETHPTVYVLDADYSFAIARNILRHLADRDDIRPAIVIGIAYGGPAAYRRHRTRDYTPTHVPTGGYGPRIQAVSGGGPQFLRFIERELIPFIEQEYRTDTERVLVGHSYGGLFAAWAALTRTELFDGYVIVSPSLWYDDGLLFDVERGGTRTRAAFRASELRGRVYLAVGDREINARRNMVADLRRLVAALQAHDYSGLRLQWSVETGETHNSVFPGALSDGLRFVLDGR